MAASAKSSSAIAPELLTSFGDFRFDEHPTIEPQMAMASVTQTNNARNLFLFIDLSVSLQNGGQVRSKDLKIFQNISSILKFSKFLKHSRSLKCVQDFSKFLEHSRTLKCVQDFSKSLEHSRTLKRIQTLSNALRNSKTAVFMPLNTPPQFIGHAGFVRNKNHANAAAIGHANAAAIGHANAAAIGIALKARRIRLGPPSHR